MATKLAALFGDLYEAVEGCVKRAFDAANERTAALEKRIVELEARATRYRFRWRASESYRDGDIVLHENALWSCDGGAAPGDTPGTEGAKWSLILRGRE
jgi:hypothetical protein